MPNFRLRENTFLPIFADGTESFLILDETGKEVARHVFADNHYAFKRDPAGRAAFIEGERKIAQALCDKLNGKAE